MRAISGYCGSFLAKAHCGGRQREISLASPEKSGFAFAPKGSQPQLTDFPANPRLARISRFWHP